MKTYNFNKNEIWFTCKALQWLTCCPEKRTFMTHVKKAYLSNYPRRLDQSTRDTVYITRDEGGRKVRRKTEIFDLNASYSIICTFDSSDFLDYDVICERFKSLCAEYELSKKEGLISAAKEKNGGMMPDYVDVNDLEMLRIIVGGNEINDKRRIITYFAGDGLRQAFEDEVIGDKTEIRRVRFKEKCDKNY